MSEHNGIVWCTYVTPTYMQVQMYYMCTDIIHRSNLMWAILSIPLPLPFPFLLSTTLPFPPSLVAPHHLILLPSSPLLSSSVPSLSSFYQTHGCCHQATGRERLAAQLTTALPAAPHLQVLSSECVRTKCSLVTCCVNNGIVARNTCIQVQM